MNSRTPMLHDMERRTGAPAAKLLAGAHHTAEDNRAVGLCVREASRCSAPVPHRTGNSPKAHDEVITNWLARMQMPEAKRRMRAPARLCELANVSLLSEPDRHQALFVGRRAPIRVG